MEGQKRRREEDPAGGNSGPLGKKSKVVRRLGQLVSDLLSVLGTVEEAVTKESISDHSMGDAQPQISVLSAIKRTAYPMSTSVVGVSSSQVAAEVDARSWGLNAALVSNVERLGLSRFFPVQREVIPLLLHSHAGRDETVGDVCVSAPTGSGKTLVYVLPILQAAMREAGRCGLIALVLLPTRELAAQVASVFVKYAQGTGIRIGVIAGSQTFADEEAAISATAAGKVEQGMHVLVATPGRLMDHLDRSESTRYILTGVHYFVIDEADRLLAESYSGWARRLAEAMTPATGTAADVVGRYTCAVDDLPPTPSPAPRSADLASIAPTLRRGGGGGEVGCRLSPLPLTIAGGVGASAASSSALRPLSWLRPDTSAHMEGRKSIILPSPIPVPLRRIVCSATLTTNPQKLASLGLQSPMHFVSTSDVSTLQSATTRSGASTPADEEAVGQGQGEEGKRAYVLPSSLHHAQCVVAPDAKPVALLQLLRLLEGQGQGATSSSPSTSGLRALVFTNTVETAHRLCRLLQLFGGLSGRVVEFSASLTATQRGAVLAAIAAGAISVLITSDAAARGLDMPALAAVVNYDAPPRIKTYVHRAGRTARAGRTGVCYTLITPEQARHFRLLTNRITCAPIHAHAVHVPARVLKETVLDATRSAYAPRMQQVLARLKSVLEEEGAGSLLPTGFVPPLGSEGTG